MIEINLLQPKCQVRSSRWIYLIFLFNKGKNWIGIEVRKTENSYRPSYYQIAKVKDVYLSQDN